MFKTVFAVLAIIGTSGILLSQEGGRRQRPEIEQLKALEPLLGKFVITNTNRNGDTVEIESTRAWGPGKQMIITTDRMRMGDGEWQDIESREFLYWNAIDERIELSRINPQAGGVAVYEVTASENNEFAFKLISGNRPGAPDPVSWTVSEEVLLVKGTRTGPDGLGRQMRISMKRVE